MPEIDRLVDGRRHLDGGDQAADRAGADGDGDGADGIEELVLDVARHVGGLRGGEHQARRVGHGQAVGEPAQAEVGDRRHIDQDLARHDEEDGEHQELDRKGPGARRADDAARAASAVPARSASPLIGSLLTSFISRTFAGTR